MTKVESVKDAMVTAFGNIKTGNGYSNSVRDVFTRVMEPLTTPSPNYPFLRLLAQGIAFEDSSDIAQVGGDITWVVEGWVRLNDDGDPHTPLSSLLQDVVDVVQANPTWSGETDHTNLINVAFEYGESEAAFALELTTRIYEAVP